MEKHNMTKPTDTAIIMEKYEIPNEYRDAIVEAYEAGAMMALDVVAEHEIQRGIAEFNAKIKETAA